MNQPLNEQTDIEQLLRTAPPLRDAGFSESVMQRVHSDQRHRRNILASVWGMALLALLLTAWLKAPWQSLLDIVSLLERQISGYATLLSPGTIEYPQASVLLQNYSVLLVSLAALLIVFFAGAIAQD